METLARFLVHRARSLMVTLLVLGSPTLLQAQYPLLQGGAQAPIQYCPTCPTGQCQSFAGYPQAYPASMWTYPGTTEFSAGFPGAPGPTWFNQPAISGPLLFQCRVDLSGSSPVVECQQLERRAFISEYRQPMERSSFFLRLRNR